MIQIYDPGNTKFDFNGDATLDPYSCECTMILNDAWSLELEAPIDEDGKFKHIVKEAVISAPTPVSDRQLFRIYETEKTESSVTAIALPIFCDSKDDHVLLDVRPTAKNGQQALDIICAGSKYSGQSNITKADTAYYIRKNLMEAIHGDIDQSFVSRWGGEILYDNYKIIINERIGGDYGARAEFGYNLDGIKEHVDMSNVVTRIIPIAYNGHTLDGETPWVDSPNIKKYQKVYTRTMEFSDVKLKEDSTDYDENACETLEELRSKLVRECQKQFAAGIDLPEITYEVDMVCLDGTEEYKDYENLEKVGLGDDVKCKHHILDIETTARVTELTYDCINRRNQKVKLGKFSKTAFDSQFDTEHKVDSIINPDGSIMAEKVQGILNGIYTQMKLQSTVAQKVKGRAFTVEDLDPDSPLYGCMTWGTQGLQLATKRTADGRDWDWTTAITAQGIVADAIITGLLSDKTGRNFWNLDTGEFRLSAEAFRVDDDTLEDYINGKVEDAAAQIRLLTMQLSNDMCSVATEADGTGGDYSECYTEVMLLIGTTDITNDERVRYTVNASAGVDGNWDLTRKRYSVTGMSEDNGSVTITADYSGLIVSKTFSISKSKAGETGEDGRTYILQPDSLVLKQGADNAYTPRSVTFSAFYRDGTAASRIPYSGRFKIEESTDGTAYVAKYFSSGDEDSHVHTPMSINVKSIRCTLYASGGTNTSLDVQSIAVVRDVDNLTQEEVFNILTDNGRLQGIFMKDGMLYLNGSYIKSGKVSGEYVDARNLTVKNSHGEKTLAVDADGNVDANVRSLSIAGAAVASEAYADKQGGNLLKGSKLTEADISEYWDVADELTYGQSDPMGGKDAVRLETYPIFVDDTGSAEPDGFLSAKYSNNNPITAPGVYEARVWLKANQNITIKVSVNRTTFDCSLTTAWKQYRFMLDVKTPNKQGYQNFTIGGWGSITDNDIIYIYKPEVIISYSSTDIFNLLTNNGAMQGIFMRNNQLYIKGEYIDVDDLRALKATIGGFTISTAGIYKGCTSLTSKGKGVYIGTNGLRFYYSDSNGNERSFTFNTSNGAFDIVGSSIKFNRSRISNENGAITIKYGLHVYTSRSGDFTDGSTGEILFGGLPITTSGYPLVRESGSVPRICAMSSSSKRYKDHIAMLKDAEAEKLLDIPVVWFRYKEGYLVKEDRFVDKPLPGFYAEDVYRAFPECAMQNPDTSVEDWNYRTLIPPMLKLIQNLYKEIKILKEKVS